MSKAKTKKKNSKRFVPDPDSPVRISLTLRYYQVEGLGGRDAARDFLYNAINAVTVVSLN